MSTDVEPAELARLLDFPERSRVDDWGLRSAVVRFGQPEPERASRLLEVVRRTEGALHSHLDQLRADGPALWRALTEDTGAPDGSLDRVLGLLHVATELDRAGDALAAWAADWPGPPPTTEVDAVTSDVAERLDALGVPAEEGPPPGVRSGRAGRG